MQKHDLLTLEIQDLAFGGKGIAKIQRPIPDSNETRLYPIFVDGTLPGQTVEAKITKVKKKYATAKCLKITKRSPKEISIPYQDTPGAPWMRLPIEMQLEIKKEQVIDCFHKFAHLQIAPLIEDIIPSPQIWNYRNKMEFSFGPTEETFQKGESAKYDIWTHTGYGLGSKKRGQFHLVTSLEKPSGLFDEDFENLLPHIRTFCQETNLPVYNQRTNKGFFRHLVVRKSHAQNNLLVNLITTSTHANQFPKEEFQTLLQKNLGARLHGLVWSLNDAISDTTQPKIKQTQLCGHSQISEHLNNLNFEMGLESFFQTNPKSAENLYKRVVEYAQLQNGDPALDLYCGTGTIAQVLAKANPKSKITGVEIVPEAVADAKKNARSNQLQNVTFVSHDVKTFLKENIESIANHSTIILDPPRAGMAKKALERIIKTTPKKIVYVSCNPATMARDTKYLQENDFALQKITLIDQFPHTSHIECIGLYESNQ